MNNCSYNSAFMNRRRRIRAAVVLALVVLPALAVARSVGPAEDIPAGTGYAALDLCTRTMQIGTPLARVRERYVAPKVHPLPALWSIDYRPGVRVEVWTLVPTLARPRVAIHRKGLGCTIVPPGSDERTVRAQPFTPVQEPARDARPWPLGEGAAERGSDAQRATIERHARRIFAEDSRDPRQGRNTTVLLVAQGGKLIFERYGDGYAREQPQLGWSMTKTLTAIIAGLLERDRKIALDAEVGLRRWANTEKRAITWRQLLNMAPGLAWFEGYGGLSDATEMLFSQADQGLWAADRPRESEPGTVFTYSTGFTNIAMRRIRELLGGSHQAVYDYYQRELFAPLGIRGGVIEPDASGTPVGGARGVLRPVDWLRLGQLVAGDGTWRGKTLLTPEYLRFMRAASPASASYGGSIWREASPMIEPRLRARLPDDIVWFAGHMGQYMAVAPAQQLVVLRMGVSMRGSMQRDAHCNELFALVADLL
jgi:CubicO group peptidase (beta-lactamase class C family)